MPSQKNSARERILRNKCEERRAVLCQWVDGLMDEKQEFQLIECPRASKDLFEEETAAVKTARYSRRHRCDAVNRAAHNWGSSPIGRAVIAFAGQFRGGGGGGGGGGGEWNERSPPGLALLNSTLV